MGNLFGGGRKSAPAPPPPPQAPAPQEIETDVKKKLRQGAAGRTQTVFSSPLGAGPAGNSGGKDLLGG